MQHGVITSESLQLQFMSTATMLLYSYYFIIIFIGRGVKHNNYSVAMEEILSNLKRGQIKMKNPSK